MGALSLGAGLGLGHRGGAADAPPAPAAPAVVQTPRIVGSGRIGEPLTVLPGLWSGVPAPVLSRQWLRDGAAIEGARGTSLVPGPADDLCEITCIMEGVNPSGAVSAMAEPVLVVHAPPGIGVPLPDVILPQNSGVHALSTESAFTGGSLSFHVAGDGVSIDPETGVLSVLTDALASGLEVTVTASNSGGTASSSFRLSVVAVEPEAVAPDLVTGPSLAGTGVIGEPVEVDPGTWSGTPAPVLSLRWQRDGVEIEGATGAVYVPMPADDGAALRCLVTATNDAGAATAETQGLTIRFAAPVAAGGLADVSFEQGSGAQAIDAAVDFTGEALAYAVSGEGAVIDAASGMVSLDTDVVRTDALVVVTASNSGGSAQSSFRVTVAAAEPAAVPPVVVVAPTLTGSGVVGTTLTVDPGTWSGDPAPVISLQWRRDGVDIPGATGTSRMAVAGDDRAALSCLVTATNSAGSAAAETGAVLVAHAAPRVVAALADLQLDQGSGLRTVSAQAVFEGEGLVFTLDDAPQGVTVDAGSGLVSIATDAPLEGAVVAVRAENSGGAAVASFMLEVRVAGTVFDTGAALGTVAFLHSGGAPSWTLEAGGFARLMPAVNGSAHGAWSGAAGDGIYRCLARWSGNTSPQTVNRPFSFGARLRKEGNDFFGIRLDVYEVSASNRQLQLRQFTGGRDGTLALGSGVAVGWAWDEWHWVEMAVQGAEVRARIYPEAGPVPDWQVTAGATELAPGGFGPGAISRSGVSPAVDIRRLEFAPGSQDAEAPAAPLDSDWDIAQFTERT